MSDINISVSELYAIIGQKEIVNYNLKKELAEARQRLSALINEFAEYKKKQTEAPVADSN